MDRREIECHAKTIENRLLALKWLTEHGAQLTGKQENGEASFDIHLHFAGSIDGASHASRLIEGYAVTFLPEIIKVAIERCRNDIAISRDMIERQLASLDVPS